MPPSRIQSEATGCASGSPTVIKPGTEATIWQVAYYSSAAYQHETADLRRIIGASRRRNSQLGVTGMLIYWQQSFFQVIEGPRTSVETIFDNYIEPARSHTGIIKAMSGTISERAFPSWSMAAHVANDSDILPLEALASQIRDGNGWIASSETTGTALLKTFLSTSTRFAD